MPIYQNHLPDPAALPHCGAAGLSGGLRAAGAAVCLSGLQRPHRHRHGTSLAEGMLALADERGALKPGQPVIEASCPEPLPLALTLAGLTAGHPVVLTMPEDAPALRQEQLLRLGARILHVPARGGLSAGRGHWPGRPPPRKAGTI